MKVAFVALSALAASAFANPASSTADDIGDVLNQLQALLGGEAFGDIASAIHEESKRDVEIRAPVDLSGVLAGGLGSIRTNTASINSTLAEVKSGSVSKDEGSAQVTAELDAINLKLSDILEEVLGSVGVDVDGANLDNLLGGTTELLSEVLHTVKGAVNILGVSKALSNVVDGIVCVLGDLVQALGDVVGKVLPNLLPTLVKTLRGLVSGLRKGVLSPLLRGLADVLNGLAG